jgi:hypothetical protein
LALRLVGTALTLPSTAVAFDVSAVDVQDQRNPRSDGLSGNLDSALVLPAADRHAGQKFMAPRKSQTPVMSLSMVTALL